MRIDNNLTPAFFKFVAALKQLQNTEVWPEVEKPVLEMLGHIEGVIAEGIKANTVEETNTSRGNTATDELVGLNFKVNAAFRRDFRMFCASHDMTLVDALGEAFFWLKLSRGWSLGQKK